MFIRRDTPPAGSVLLELSAIIDILLDGPSPAFLFTIKDAQINSFFIIIKQFISRQNPDTPVISIECQLKIQRLVKIDNPPKLNNEINPIFDN